MERLIEQIGTGPPAIIQQHGQRLDDQPFTLARVIASNRGFGFGTGGTGTGHQFTPPEQHAAQPLERPTIGKAGGNGQNRIEAIGKIRAVGEQPRCRLTPCHTEPGRIDRRCTGQIASAQLIAIYVGKPCQVTRYSLQQRLHRQA